MTIKLSIPFGYDATLITKSNERVPRTYREYIDVEIPEVGDSEAPVVLMCPRFRTAAGISRTEPVPHRWFDDRLVEPLWLVGYDQETRRMTPKVLSGREGDLPLLIAGMHSHLRTMPLGQTAKRLGPPRERKLFQSDREVALENATKVAHGLVVVDGELHCAVAEPVLVARPGELMLLENDEFTFLPSSFRLDEVHLAVERAAVLGDVSPEKVYVPQVEVMAVDWLKRDFTEIGLLRGALLFQEETAKDLAGMPLPVMLAYDDLRAATRTNWKDMDIQAAGVALMTQALCDRLEEAGMVDRTRLARHVLAVAGERMIRAEAAPAP